MPGGGCAGAQGHRTWPGQGCPLAQPSAPARATCQGLIQIRATTSPAPLPGQTPRAGPRDTLPVLHAPGTTPQGDMPAPVLTPWDAGTRPCRALCPRELSRTVASGTPLCPQRAAAPRCGRSRQGHGCPVRRGGSCGLVLAGSAGSDNPTEQEISERGRRHVPRGTHERGGRRTAGTAGRGCHTGCGCWGGIGMGAGGLSPQHKGLAPSPAGANKPEQELLGLAPPAHR